MLAMIVVVVRGSVKCPKRDLACIRDFLRHQCLILAALTVVAVHAGVQPQNGIIRPAIVANSQPCHHEP